MNKETREKRKQLFELICERHLKALEEKATQLAGNMETGMVLIANVIMIFLDSHTIENAEDITSEMLLKEMEEKHQTFHIPYMAPGYRLINLIPCINLLPLTWPRQIPNETNY